MKAESVFKGSDGEVTKEYYKQLINRQKNLGQLAVGLFRALKCSSRAKEYRKRRWTNEAYDRKRWSIGEIVKILSAHPNLFAQYGIDWGWKEDPNTVFEDHASFVFYCDLPEGQVSFHCRERGEGKDYSKEWDGARGMSYVRIINFCDKVFNL